MAIWRWAGVTMIVGGALACAPSTGHGEGTAATDQRESPAPAIRHLVPATDSIGGLPERFEWTPVDGADRYAISVFTDVDRLLWQRSDLETPSVDRPEGLDLEAGTYFWRVSAIRDDRQVADSGWSAFIVRR